METKDITFRTRKWVRPEDLNANGTLFGGSLLKWIDEEAAIYAILQLGNGRAVTKYISEINFVSSAVQGDLIEMGLTATRFGRTSLTMRAEVRNMITRQSILTIEEIVFVKPLPSMLQKAAPTVFVGPPQDMTQLRLSWYEVTGDANQTLLVVTQKFQSSSTVWANGSMT